MGYEFNKLKADNDIVDIINRRVRLTKKGAEYVGKCPFHNDSDPSLTVNPKKQLFWCPVCADKKGDVVDFLLAYGLTYKEAAEELHGGPLDKPAPEQKIIAKRTPPPKWTALNDTTGAPEPDFTHYKYGIPSRVWAYHNADGGVIGYACRFDFDDGSKDVLPFTYATDGKRTMWKYGGFAKPRPLYNLHKIAGASTIILVEGEKAADCINELLSGSPIVAVSWMGGVGQVEYADYTPLHGKTVIFWPDNDAVGRKAMTYIANQLSGKIKAAKYVHVPIEMDKGWDVADGGFEEQGLRQWLRTYMHDEIWNEDKSNHDNHEIQTPNDGAFPQNTDEQDKVDNNRQPNIQAGAEPNVSVTPPLPPAKKKDDPSDNPYFKILGFEPEDDGVKYVFFNKGLKRLFRVKSASMSKAFFNELASPTFWESQFPDGQPGHYLRWIVDVCGHKPVFDDSVIRGGGAWFDAGRAVLHVGEYLFVDGERVDLEDFQTDFLYQKGTRMNFNVCEPLTIKESKKFVDFLRRLKWERDVNAELLAGWCVVAPICGALDWRPHIWVTGPAGTGKSWVFENIVSRMVGNIALRVQGETSEAGIRQSLGHDARPVIFDESEAETKKSQDRVDSILTLVRSSSSSDGGLMIKGSAGGTAKTYQIRSCFAFASIAVPISQQSDRSRITMLVLAKPGLNTEEFTAFSAEYMEAIDDEYIDALRTRTIRMIPTIKANAKTFAKACAVVLGSQRAGDQAGALLAGAYALESDDLITYDDALARVQKYDWSEEKSLDTTRDEMRLFNHIMGHIVRGVDGDGSAQRTIGELVMIAAANAIDYISAESASRSLGRLGIKVKDGQIVISNDAATIGNILKDTPWTKNHNKILVRIDGAKPLDATSFASGTKSRAVGIPITLLSSENNLPTTFVSFPGGHITEEPPF